jgi:meso-butanediol dehydrogenase / (S,S)-butanediol dehydrogenase / diacetyl reductase
VSNSEVKDKVAIVTGAAGGLGFGIAARLAEEQAVLLTDINAKLLREAAAKLAADGATVAHVACDVSDRASMQAAFAAAEDQLGEVTALANVAGIAKYSPFVDLTEEMWDRTYAINVKGTFLACQEFIKRRNGRPGAIVNISSIGARLGLDMLVDYGSSKAAVIELSHSLARIGAPTGLRVNAVMPGLIWTPMWKGGAEWLLANGVAPAGMTPEELFAMTVEKSVPMKRPQTLADLGEMVAFLLSDKARNVTGQTIAVDGGVLMT